MVPSVRRTCGVGLVGLALVLPPSANAYPTAKVAANCRPVYGSDGFSARQIRTRRISCRKARRVLARWLEAHGYPPAGPRNWRCAYNVGGRNGRWHCRNSGRLIAFTYYADE